ncbi:MAG: kinase/pyrophosphorylase [Betaproteobacteria bacterium]|nr:MAG: kinase/pyrophosphorylase [Betaproteobacteria bacterium]
MPLNCTAFFVSDRTGITAEMLGHSILTQFDDVIFNEITVPFVDTEDKAWETVARINRTALSDASRPLVFSTLVNEELSAIVQQAEALYLDCFQVFIAPIEAELGIRSSHTVGRSHSVRNNEYYNRMEAVNFALAADDGQSIKDLEAADIILVGVSRSGKTPTCLYLGLQYGIRAANYPLIPEDFDAMRLPGSIDRHRSKLFGLTIRPERLHRVRNERRPGSRYASMENCEHEVRAAESLMRQEDIPVLDTTTRSIEELATVILHQANLQRHIY